MRRRFKPYAHDELMAADFHVHEPLIWGGKWHAQYARPEQPFVLELGCGKGGFLSQLACAHPENNYLGIDITDKVLILAKRKIEAAYQAANRPIDNVKIMSTDIERIKGVITAEDEVSRIYINFCNPWSKNGSSHKHRLTYPRQLINYRAFLKDGGEIYFKTDDDDLFRDSLEYFPASGYDIEWMTYDLHENDPHRARGHVHRDGHQDQGPHRPQKARRRQRDLDRAQGAQAHGTGGRRSRGGCQGRTGRREQCLTPVNCA